MWCSCSRPRGAARRPIDATRRSSPSCCGSIASRWNRGEKPRGLRRVMLPSPQDAENRQLTAFRKRLGECRTKTLNKIQLILMRHNLQQECPTHAANSPGGPARVGRTPVARDRSAGDEPALAQWTLWDRQLAEVEKKIVERHAEHADAQLIATIPEAATIRRWPWPRESAASTASRVLRACPIIGGITPGCRNSGGGDWSGWARSPRRGAPRWPASSWGNSCWMAPSQGPVHEGLVSANQASAGVNCAGGRDASLRATIIWHMLHDKRSYQQVRDQEQARGTPRGVAGTCEESPQRRLAAGERGTAKRAKTESASV